jgi:2-hydroxy-6-oxonona-2,4-dienedioate hydrolase
MSMNESRYRDAEQRFWRSIGASPTEQRIHLKRNDVTVRVQEVGHGPPVLFIHGALASGVSWANLAATMKGFRCVLLDRPGTGLSDALGTHLTVNGLPQFAETLAIDVLDALELDRAHIVSSSFGGYFALRTAWAHPDRVDRMVHFSFPVGARMEPPPVSMRLLSVPILRRLLVAVPPSARMLRGAFSRMGHGESVKTGRITQEILDGYAALLKHTDTLRNDFAMGSFFSVRGLNSLALPDDLLAEIKTPVFFFWGTNDPNGGADTAQAFVDRIPNATLELLEGGGHASWLDDLDRAARATMTFLGGASG